MPTSADLQLVSVAPVRATIKKGSSTVVKVHPKNNGPDVLPAGEARIQFTIDGRIFNKPSGFGLVGKGKWKKLAIKKSDDGLFWDVFVTNSTALQVNEPYSPGFKFTVKARAVGVGRINGVSSVSGTATASDPDGQNQSASTEIIVS